jgi:tetratricopeptide (TPR) repeat protein
MELKIEQALQQGVNAHNAGNLQAAERAYHAILQSQPKHPDANHNLGLIAISVNQIEAALLLFKTALDVNPKIEQFWISYIDALVKAKHLNDAKQAIKKAKKKGFDAKKLEALLSQSKDVTDNKVPSQELLNSLLEDFQNGRFSDAEKLATTISQQFPSDNFSWKILAAVFKATGRNSEAVNANQTAVTLIPDDVEAHYNLGNTLKELGRLDEALASYKQATALKPDYAEAHSNLGATLKELGRLDEALASYKQAIVLKPDLAEAHYNLGILWFESGQYSLAAEKFELSNIKKSKLFRIKCSFVQDEETIFYKKFDLLVNQGEINAVMGSLAFRSEFKYGIEKSNPFCSDPLSYVVKTDLNELYDFKNIFIDTAKDILTDNSVSYMAQGHLTNGVQTSGNIFVQGKVLKTEIENIIHTEIEKYQIQFKDSEEGFIKNWPTSYEIKGWLVCMQSGGKLAPHMHDSGWITGSIYINVPPKSKTDCGNLVLCLSDQEHVLAVEKNQQSTIDVVTGSLCLFPSSLHHYTVPFEEKEDRIVLAFDVIPKDKTIN